VALALWLQHDGAKVLLKLRVRSFITLAALRTPGVSRGAFDATGDQAKRKPGEDR
jgi:hypothetical protein